MKSPKSLKSQIGQTLNILARRHPAIYRQEYSNPALRAYLRGAKVDPVWIEFTYDRLLDLAIS